jgi:flagellar biosynthesis protein FliR
VESVYNFSMTEILAFALVLLRMSAFIVTMPVFGASTVPTPIKILFALSMTFVVFPQIGWRQLTADIESLTIVSMAVKEVAVGLFFGFVARLFFSAVSMAGQVMSVSLGISAAQLFNPAMGETSTAFDQLYVALASLFFLSVNGHHLLITGLVDSFHMISLQNTSLHLMGLQDFGVIVQKITVIAVKMSAPLMVTILFMNIAIAVVGRAVPQINILITSLPVNILIGLLVVMFSLPLLIWQMNDLLGVTSTELFRLLKSF